MIFHNHQKNVSLFKELTLELNGESIKRSDTFNFLGIVLNEQLTWNSHITHLSSKIHPVVGLLHRLKYQLPTKILKMIYNSLILSRLHYANILWGGRPGSLIKLNKKALRAIGKVGCNTHTNPIEKRLNLLSVPDIHKLKLFCFYRKIIYRDLPIYILRMFENMNFGREPDYPKSVKYRNTIRFEMPYFLQTAPNEIIEKVTNRAVSFCSFKSSTKKYIIERYSSLCTVIGCGSCHLRIRIN